MAKTPSKLNRKNLSNNRWFANVAKSLGYSAADIVGELMPASSSTFKNNKEYIKDVVNEIKTASKQKGISSALRKMTGDALDDYLINGSAAIANIKEDWKSGKFYNKERVSAIQAKDMGMDDFNMDDLDNDDNWSMDDFDIDEDIESSGFDENETPEVNVNVTPKISITSNINGNNSMVKAVHSQSDLMVNIAKDTASRDIKMHSATLALNQKMIYGVGEHLSSINENLGRLLEFSGDTISKFTSASLAYYEESLNINRDLLEELRSFNSKDEKDDDSGYATSPFDYSGAINIKDYISMVKGNTKRWANNNFILSSLNMFKESNGLEQLAANPLGFIPRMIISSMIPKNLRKSGKRFDDTLGAFFPALLSKVDALKGSSNIFAQTIGEILGYKQDIKTYVNPEKYERGKVDFDGITRKSIVEVIPGYLSKILDAVQGREERLTYNYDKGKFTTYKELEEKFTRDSESAILSSYDGLDKIFDILNFASIGGNSKALDPFKEKLKKGFLRYTGSNMFINPDDYDEESDEGKNTLAEVFTDLTDDEQRLFRVALSKLSHGELMNLFGRNKFEAREARTDFFKDAEEKNIGSVLFNDLYKDRTTTSNESGVSSPDLHEEDLSNLTPEERRAREKKKKKAEEDAKKSLEERGILAADSFDDITSMDTEDLSIAMDEYIARSMSSNTNDGSLKEIIRSKQEEISKKGLFANIQNLLQAPARVAEKFINKLDEGLYKIIFPSRKGDEEKEKKSIFEYIGDKFTNGLDWIKGKLDSFLTKADEKLFGEEGLITRIQNSERWQKIKDFFGKGFDFAFGKKDGDKGYREGGLFSDVFNNMKEMGNRFISYFTGKDFIDIKGNLIKGDKDGSVFGIFKNQLVSFKDTIAEYIFGSSDKEGIKDKAGGFLSGIKDTLQEGAQTWLDAIFGLKDKAGEKVSSIDVTDFTEKVKNALPKALAVGLFAGGAGLLASAGGFGILGSMFLGPMSGAVLGITGGFLSQSNRFKDWLFGPEINGARIGGFITKGTQEFLKANKTTIIGGGTIGAISGGLGLGFLPSFILGGPLTGAIFGIASGLLLRSEWFKNLLFGAKDAASNAGLSKIAANFGKNFIAANKQAIGSSIVGGIGGLGLGVGLKSFGLLGGMAINPLGVAIAGAATGILLTSNRWRDMLFGKAEFDSKGNLIKDGGVFGRFGNYLKMEVLEPFKFTMHKWSANVANWFEQKIAVPFAIATTPIKEEFKRIGIRLREFGESVKSVISNLPGVDLLKNFIKKLNPVEPFKFVAKFMIEKTANVFGKMIEFPVKILTSVSEKLYNRHLKEGLKYYRGLIADEIKRRLVESPIVQEFVKPAFTFIKDRVDDVGRFAKKTISGIFGFLGKAVLGFTKLAFKGLAATISAPFKALALPFQLIGAAKGALDRRDAAKGADSNILNRAKDAGSESLGGLLGMLVGSFLPGATRRSFKYSPEGAAYANDWNNRKQELIKDAESRGKSRNDLINEEESDLRERQKDAKNNRYNSDVSSDIDNSSNKPSLLDRVLNRNNNTSESNTEPSFEDKNGFIDSGYIDNHADESNKKRRYKLIDKDLKRKYGNLSPLDRDRFKLENNNSRALLDINKLVSDIKDLISDNKNNKDIDTKETENKDISSDIDTSKNNKDTSITDTFAIAVAKGQEIFDDKDDIEEAERREKEDKENKRDLEIAADVATDKSKNLLNNRAEAAQMEERNERKSFFNTMKKFVGDIRDDEREHKFNWASIFSKKGLITTGLLLALPWLIDFLKDPAKKFSGLISSIGSFVKNSFSELFGNTDADGNRTTAYGDTIVNSDTKESFGVAAASNAVRAVHTIGNKAYQIGDNIKGIADTAKRIFKPGANTNVADDVINNTSYRYNGVHNNSGSVTNTARRLTSGVNTNVIDDVIELTPDKHGVYSVSHNYGTGNAVETTMQKFIQLAKNVLDAIEKFLQKKAPNAIGTITSILTKVRNGLTLQKLLKLGSSLKTRIGVIVTKFFASSATMLLADAVFMGYGAVTGVTKSETANLFNINQEDVTPGMQTVSSIIKAITSSSYGSIAALISDIVKSIIGFDFFQTLAEVIYSKFGGDGVKLSAAQQSFDEEYERNKMLQAAISGTDEDRNLYQTIKDQEAQLKANPELANDVEFMNSYQTNKNALSSKSNYSKDAFNDQQNKSTFTKIKDLFSKPKRFLFGNKGNEEKLTQAQEFKSKMTQMIAEDPSLREDPEFMEMLENVNRTIKENEAAKGLFTPLLEKFAHFGSSMKNLIPILINDSAKQIIAAKNGENFVSEYTVLSDSDAAASLQNAIIRTNYIMGIPRAAIIGLGSLIIKQVAPLFNWFKQIFNVGLFDLSSGLNLALNSGIGQFYSSYFSDIPADDAGNPASGFRSFLFIANRLFTFMPLSVINLGATIGRHASDIWNMFKSTVSAIKDDFTDGLTYAASGANMFSSSYFTPPADDNGNPASGFRSFLFYANRLYTFMPLSVINLGAKIVKFISPLWNGIKNIGSDIFTDIESATDSNKSLDDYFTYSNNNNSPFGALDKILFYGSRALLLPIFAIRKVIDFVGNGISNGINWIKDKFSSIINALDLTGQAGADTKETDTKETDTKEANTPAGKIGSGAIEPKSKFSNKTYEEFIKGHQGGAVLDQYKDYKKHLTSDFGQRRDPIDGVIRGHSGVDMAKGLGSKIGAFVPGIVEEVNYIDDPNSRGKAYGNNVIIKDKYDKYHLYAHMNSISVKKGQNIELGQTIGTEGTTGRSTGPHLHYSVMGSKFNDYIDPDTYIEGYDSGNPNLALSQDTGDFTSVSSDGTSGVSSVIGVMTNTLNNILAKTGLTSMSSSSSTDSSSSSSDSGLVNTNLPDGDVPDKVWQFFTQNGYSKAATAGIMGNLYVESTMDPAKIQTDSGHAAGIAQWESYKNKSGRWLSMSNYAKSKGKDWTDLGSQLEFIHTELPGLDTYFKTDIKYGGNIAGSTLSNAGAVPTTYNDWKKSTDVDMATRQFEGAFERAGTPHMDRRLEAARGYYQKYANTGIGGEDLDTITIDNHTSNENFVLNSPKDLFKENFTNIGKGGIGEMLETVASTAKANGTDSTIVDNFIKIISLLTEIATNTRKTTENTAKIATSDNSNTTAVIANTNNVSSNPMFDIARQRREEQTRSKYSIAKAIAQGIQ